VVLLFGVFNKEVGGKRDKDEMGTCLYTAAPGKKRLKRDERPDPATRR